MNNAGILPDNTSIGIFEDHSFLDVEISKFQDALNVNVLGAVRVTKALLPLMLEDPASKKIIINISSRAGQMSSLDWGIPAYSVSKVALNAVSKLVAKEFSPQQLICVAFSPGWVRTDMGGKSGTKDIDQAAREFLEFLNGLKVEDSGRFFRDGKEIE